MDKATDHAALIALLQQVWTSHADPNDSDYNECDTDPCMWCEETKAAATTLAAHVPPRSSTAKHVGEKWRVEIVKELLFVLSNDPALPLWVDDGRASYRTRDVLAEASSYMGAAPAITDEMVERAIKEWKKRHAPSLSPRKTRTLIEFLTTALGAAEGEK